MKKHAKRVYGVMDALVRVMKESKRPYYTIPEIVELVQKVVAGKTRTIEVMATRDCIKRNILYKTDFKIKSEKNWRTIYAACGTEVNIEMLQPLYKAIRTKPATKRKVREALKEPDTEQGTAEPEDTQEISATVFGEKIIEYIKELKRTIAMKDTEMERVLRGGSSAQQDLRNTISGLNKKIAEQNKELEVMRNRVKIRRKGGGGTFKLSEVAHIK